jgi:CBS domain-containing protein
MRLAAVVKVLPTLDLNSTIEDAAKIFKSRGADAVVVLEDKTPVGMLSAFEVLEKIVEGARSEDIPIKDLMNHNILVIDGGTNPKDAAKTMLDHKHWMAVVTEKGEYKGVVTAGDLVKALV